MVGLTERGRFEPAQIVSKRTIVTLWSSWPIQPVVQVALLFQNDDSWTLLKHSQNAHCQTQRKRNRPVGRNQGYWRKPLLSSVVCEDLAVHGFGYQVCRISIVRNETTERVCSSFCPWKGFDHILNGSKPITDQVYVGRTASYYNATVDGKTVNDVAWYVCKWIIDCATQTIVFLRYYPSTSEKGKPIEGYVAFYKVSKMSFFVAQKAHNWGWSKNKVTIE